MELGGYIGYSAVRIASQIPPGGKLYSIDPNETHVRIARSIIQHAGLSDRVEVIQGILETSIQVGCLPQNQAWIFTQKLQCMTD